MSLKVISAVSGYGIRKNIPRTGLSKCFDILPLLRKYEQIAFVCKSEGDYLLKLYNPTSDILEGMADLSQEYEGQFNNKVTIVPFHSKKKS